jgi:hypothetical protein
MSGTDRVEWMVYPSNGTTNGFCTYKQLPPKFIPIDSRVVAPKRATHYTIYCDRDGKPLYDTAEFFVVTKLED